MDGKLRNMTALYVTDRTDAEYPRLLMLYRIGSKVVEPSWCGIGGHFEKDELNDARACVIRELKEELGLSLEDVEDVKFRYVALRSTKGEIRQNYYFFAELENAEQLELVSNEGQLRWFTLAELADLNMPFSARFMMDHYVETGRFDDKLYGGISDGTKIEFVEMQEG